MLSRRTLLRGSGLALLPLLHSLMPRSARADVVAPLRFVGMYGPNGIVPALWRPTSFGSTFDLPLSLAPLAPVRQHVSVISNLQLGDDNNMGSHDGGLKVFLTASRLDGASSINQVIGRLSESSVKLATLNLGLENNGYYWPPQIVANSQGYYQAPNGEDRQDRCNSAQCVVSVSKGSAQANVYHPQVAFERLFGSGGSGNGGSTDAGVSPAVLKEAARRRRVVDAVKGHAAALKSRISTDDRLRVEEYLEGVRRIEVELDKMTASSDSSSISTSCESVHTGLADPRGPRQVRQAHVRPHCSRLPVRRHARRHLHAGPRHEPDVFQGRRRRLLAPRRRLAPRDGRGQDAREGRDRRLAGGHLRLPRRPARQGDRRRRHTAHQAGGALLRERCRRRRISTTP